MHAAGAPCTPPVHSPGMSRQVGVTRLRGPGALERAANGVRHTAQILTARDPPPRSRLQGRTP
ncbi:hypothetical protein FRAAL6766 [Frankia alni ACN14a]|uniref:Uncharacterized protein n=1 Tax=Frankia alni (strain DSM 45986 / CECT 9034 / ACN14a) TaxID=326424 RepID=Q0RAZ9_FRAAA|nr:hypothetical protein FRAAL6766 [Frankia alni ACN14a]